MAETNGEIETKITVQVGVLEITRMDALIGAPEFRFSDRAHLVKSAILSFLAYKEEELYRIRRGERWR